MNHNWHVHVNEHGKDFYNWSKRCESAGEHFNPFNVGLGRTYNNLCNNENHFRCEVGDLTSKSKKLTIAAYKGSVDNKLFYTDTLLPLSGPNWVSHEIDFPNKWYFFASDKYLITIQKINNYLF
jgi:hypothetical protein